MPTKMMLALAGLVGGLLVAGQWTDIKRYIQIKQLSTGDGHPENVPAGGRTSYPHHHDDGVADGTGDFSSASRGGPATGEAG